jgi:hypothetical protein
MFIDQSFFDELSVLQGVDLGGSILVDMTIAASIAPDSVDSKSYTGVTISITVNRFEALAFIDVPPFSLNLPLSLPSADWEDPLLEFELIDAYFRLEFNTALTNPVGLLNLFSGDQASDSVNLDYNGTLDLQLPMRVGIVGQSIPFSLAITDSDLFNDPAPEVAYEIDTCDILTATKNLFEELKNEILAVIEAPIQAVQDTIPISIDQVTDPLIQRVNDSLTEFTDDMITSLDADCTVRRRNVRLLADDNTSLKSKILGAVESANTALSSVGIVLTADVAPYFDSKTFAAGVNTTLTATITMSASDVVGFVTDFFQGTTAPEEDNEDLSKMGVVAGGDPATAGINLDLDQLLGDTIISAGLDVTFALEINLKELQGIITNGADVGDALEEGIGLHVTTWGAFASLIVDPIKVDIQLFGETHGIRDSSIKLSAELRSEGAFFGSVKQLVDGTADASLLTPVLTVPLQSEIIFDFVVPGVNINISPILRLESTNLLNDFTVEFDADLETFLSGSSSSGGRRLSVFDHANSLDTVLEQISELLDTIKGYAPELEAGEYSLLLELPIVSLAL